MTEKLWILKSFPRRSAELIRSYFDFYESLDNGQRKPTSEKQRRFIAVCRGQERPQTEHEIAWISYKNMVSIQEDLEKAERQSTDSSEQRVASTLHKSAERKNLPIPKKSGGNTPGTKPINPEYEPRRISEPLGSREDFKRDRASWKRSH